MTESKQLDQFKTIEDLQQAIESLIKEHRVAQDARQLGVMFRVVVPPNDATTYQEGHQGGYRLVEGVRVCDYKFETATGLQYVIADRTCGLSFSKSYSHLKNTRKMLSRHARGYKKPGPAHVAWWILSEFPVPDGMEFVRDPKDNNHYFLAVVERMHITTLVSKLKAIARHMTVMKDCMDLE